MLKSLKRHSLSHERGLSPQWASQDSRKSKHRLSHIREVGDSSFLHLEPAASPFVCVEDLHLLTDPIPSSQRSPQKPGQYLDNISKAAAAPAKPSAIKRLEKFRLKAKAMQKATLPIKDFSKVAKPNSLALEPLPRQLSRDKLTSRGTTSGLSRLDTGISRETVTRLDTYASQRSERKKMRMTRPNSSLGLFLPNIFKSAN